MRGLILENPADLPAEWLRDLADEFVEDPHCRLVVLGGDREGVVLFSLWEDEVADEVAGGLRATAPASASLRLLALAGSGPEASPDLRQ